MSETSCFVWQCHAGRFMSIVSDISWELRSQISKMSSEEPRILGALKLLVGVVGNSIMNDQHAWNASS
jgi:hypothetical protein